MLPGPSRFGHDRFVTPGISAARPPGGRVPGTDLRVIIDIYCAELGESVRPGNGSGGPTQAAPNTRADPDQTERTLDHGFRYDSPPPRRSAAPARQRLHAPLATLDDRLSEADVAATLRFAEASRSANTRLAYAADWRAFVSWCSRTGRNAPALLPGLLCGHLCRARRERAAGLDDRPPRRRRSPTSTG